MFKDKGSLWYFYYVPFKIGQSNLGVLVPLLILNLGGSARDIGMASMLFSFVTLVSTIYWGRTSDRIGKSKPFITLGFLGLSVCFLLLSVAPSRSYVMIVYCAMAFFMAAELPITPIYLLRSIGKDNWDDSFSLFNLICSWALTIGLAMGGIALLFIGISHAALMFSAVTALSIVLSQLWMRDAKKSIKRAKTGIYPSHIVERKRFIPNFVLHIPRMPTGGEPNTRFFFISVILLFIGSNFVFLPIIPYLRGIGVSDTMIFFANILNFVASSVVYSLISKDMKKNGCLKVYRKGITIRIVIVASMLLVLAALPMYGFATVLLFYTLLGASWPHIYTSAVTFVSEASGPDNPGSLMGKYNAVYTLGLMIGSLASGYVFDLSSILYCLVFSMMFYVLSYFVIRRFVKRPSCVNA